MGTLTKNRFCTGQNFFLFLSWSLFIASWAIKVQNKSSVSKELKRKVDLHKYHLVFIKGMTDSCTHSVLFVKKLFHQLGPSQSPFIFFFRTLFS